MLFKEKVKWFFLLLFIFTNIYYLLDPNEIGTIKELSVDGDNSDNNYLYCFHFAVITQTTVGYGHMFPTSYRSRMIVNIHALLSVCILML